MLNSCQSRIKETLSRLPSTDKLSQKDLTKVALRKISILGNRIRLKGLHCIVSEDQIKPSVILYYTNFLLTHLEILYFELLCDGVWIALILALKMQPVLEGLVVINGLFEPKKSN